MFWLRPNRQTSPDRESRPLRVQIAADEAKPPVIEPDDHADDKGGDHRALADPVQAAEEDQRKRHRRQHQRDVKTGFDDAELFIEHLRYRVDYPLAGDHEDVSVNFEADAEGKYRAAGHQRGELRCVAHRRERGQEQHAHVNEPAKDKIDRDLQQLDLLKIPAQQQKLQEDKGAVENERKLPQRRREPQAEHIGHARYRRGAEAGLCDEAYPEGIDEDPDDKYKIAFQKQNIQFDATSFQI